MKSLSRRQFLATSLAGIAIAGCKTNESDQLMEVAEAAAGPLGIAPGCQIWPYREQLVEDISGTLQQVASYGFKNLEFCSPPGYAQHGLEPLTKYTAAELRTIIEDAGLNVVSCHYNFGQLKEFTDERIEFASELGLKHMIVATVGRPQNMDEWMLAADELNAIGEKTKPAGIQFGFHNHAQEFEMMDGVLVFDAMMDRLDGDLVKYQYHLQNPANGRMPADVLNKYPGRYCSIHIMDYALDAERSVPVGQGDLDWVKLFNAAKVGGIEYYFVEMGLDALAIGGPFLASLSV